MEHIEVVRSGGRAANQMRPVRLERDVMKNALGSCMVEFGDTRVLCAATIEEGLPAWRRASRAGWVTAEYAMLPASTNRRTRRETSARKGRSMEIERLIGRSLRTVVNLRALGEYTVTVDCDVIQADGGTRTASITGAWVALHDALMAWVDAGKIARLPLTGQVAAVSMGVVDGVELLDLDYSEDSNAEVDMTWSPRTPARLWSCREPVSAPRSTVRALTTCSTWVILAFSTLSPCKTRSLRLGTSSTRRDYQKGARRAREDQHRRARSQADHCGRYGQHA